MKIIKTLIIVSAVVFFMPSPPESETKPGPASLEIMSAAASAASDAGSFCSRQPAVCSTAASLASSLQAKARYSVKLIYEWANGAPQTGSTSVPSDDPNQVPNQIPGQVPGEAPLQTGEQSQTHAPFWLMAEANGSQNTLKLEDIIPEWRDPMSVRRG